MPMVKITNGKSITTVSQQSFENKYRRYGWRKVTQTKKVQGHTEPDSVDASPDVDTIPISDMDGAQLKEYAKANDIDISKTKSAAEARKVIQAAIRNKNM